MWLKSAVNVDSTPPSTPVSLTMKVLADMEKLLKTGDGVLWLTDRKGRRVGIPVAKIAYVEMGEPTAERRVGFGAP